MCSEVSPPRLSFSNYLTPPRVPPIEDDDSQREFPVSDSDSEFEFAINGVSELESSSADVLFSNGVLLPIQSLKTLSDSKKVHQPSPLPPLPPSIEKKGNSWGFKRSSSLKSESKKSSLWPLPILSRSNSTGSEPNSKQTSLKKQPVSTGRSSLPTQRTHLRKKNNGGTYSNSVWINPVLNLPPIFGLGSLLGSGKDKKSRK